MPDPAHRHACTPPVLLAAMCLALLLAACGIGPRSAEEAAAPADSITFAFGGDLAGQNVCRDASLGFPVFRYVLEAQPDFFVGLGDMVYADTPCEATGYYGNRQLPRATRVATTVGAFREVWRYVRDDPTFDRLLREVPYYAVWDDHEVRNDFGPGDDLALNSEDLHLLPVGREVFTEFNAVGSDRLYFRKRFGTKLDIFFLDTRSYRDPNSASDSADRPKSMLGGEQRRWLSDGLKNSGARWKIVVSSVPLSIPTGWPPERGRDGWANFDQDTGFELELISLLHELAEAKVTDLVFLSADVHFATGFRYQPFPTHPGFVFHEFVTGPLQAGLFPNSNVDETLKPERLFYHAPPSAEAVTSFAEARRWFNFGVIRIDASGRLQFRLIDGLGELRATVLIQPQSNIETAGTR